MSTLGGALITLIPLINALCLRLQVLRESTVRAQFRKDKPRAACAASFSAAEWQLTQDHMLVRLVVCTGKQVSWRVST